jgi:hypothetical protein
MAAFDHGPDLPGVGIGLDHEMPRRVIAEALGLAVRPRQDEKAAFVCRVRNETTALVARGSR